MRSVYAMAILLISTTTLKAQPKPPNPGDAMIDAYLAAQTDSLSKKFLDGAKTLPEWTAKRPRLHREYLDMLGLPPLTDKTPLKATITRTFENQGVVIDNLHFQSRPGLYVTANLYRPKNNVKKLPTILYLCGHANRGRDGNKSAYQEHGLWFAANGYNCLVLDTLQLGEIPGAHHGTYNLNRWWWHSAGYTPAGVECWNGIRAIDYLLTRDDVDPAKLGITGISGGGAATIWIAAADDRLKVVVPVSGMADLEAYVKNKIINGHCDCMFLYNTYQWEWTTILALVAPRPLLFANSDADPIFPMDANRRISARTRTLYVMYGKEAFAQEYISPGGHAYRPDLRIAIFKFFNKHLKGDPAAPIADSAAFETIPGKDLRVFPTDDDLPADRINGKIDETFVARGTVTLPAAADFGKWQKEMIERVRQRAFRTLPVEIPAAKDRLKDFKFDAPIFEAATEPEINVYGLRQDPRTLFVSSAKGNANVIKGVNLDRVSMVFPRGNWAHSWTEKSPPNTIERSHMLLGMTADQKRVLDVASTATMFRDLLKDDEAKSQGVHIVGSGTDGILAAYAALFAPAIGSITIQDPPASHTKGPHFPGILRELDIPDALGLLAPRPLTIIGDDPAFDRTAEIYRLAGAADKLKRIK